MSAFGGKADMTVCRCPLSRSLLGVKRTCLFALHMSAFDPKRTWRLHCKNVSLWENLFPNIGGPFCDCLGRFVVQNVPVFGEQTPYRCSLSSVIGRSRTRFPVAW